MRSALLRCNGFDFVPASAIRNRIASTEEDCAWLKSIGIDIGGTQ
jgi:hypothetical protein